MTRPGTQVLVQTIAPPRSSPTNTGVWFVAGITEKGAATGQILIQSMSDYATYLGARVAYGALYDALDTFFREGGNAAYVSRVLGPSPVTATKNLLDSGAGISLVVNANSPGVWGNSIKVQVTAGVVSGYQIHILDASNNLLENSGDLQTQQDAVNWSAASQYVTIVLGVTALVPAVLAATVLTGSATDDHTNIVDANWLAALNMFTKDMGPGQVSAPGRTTDLGHTQLADHAQANNRVAILDAPDSGTDATVETSATNSRTTGNGQYAAMFWPWVTVPGITAGTLRNVPPSAAVAGVIARVDASDNPNTPAAGDKGQFNYVIGLSQAARSDAVRSTYNNPYGINVLRGMYGGFRVYGYRTQADPINNPNWIDLSNVRYLMSVAARADAIGQQYVFAPIDGQGHTIAAYGGALTAMLQGDWNAGEIYGSDASQAFSVNVSASVNTPASIAGNQLQAVIAVRPSPFAELVTVVIVDTPITQDLP